MLRRNPRNLRHDVFNLFDIDALHPLLFRLQALIGARLIDHVNGLVRHMPIVDVARGQFCRGTKRLIAVFDVVMLLETSLQAAQNADRVLDRRLGDIDFLEAPRKRAILFENPTEFLESRGADAADFTGREQGLEQIGRIHYATRGSASADDRVNLIDKQNGVRPLAQLAEQRLEALLEIAPVLRARQQRAQIQRVDDAVSEQVRDLVIHDAFRQAFSDSCLTDTCLTYQKRVVLAPARENLRDTFDFILTSHQRIDPPLARQLIQITRISIQRIAGRTRLTTVLVLHFRVAFRTAGITRHLRNTVRDVVDDIDTRDVLLLEEEYGLTLLLAENRDQHVCTGHLPLARTLHVEYGTLQNTLEAKRRLGFTLFIVLWNKWSGGINEFLQIVA